MFDLHRASESRVRSLLVAVALLGAAACSEKVEGPKPSIAGPSKDAAPPPVDPDIVCRAQLTTEVTLHGEQLSPIPIDVPKDPKLALPTVTLSRTHELDGAEAGAADVVVYSGNSDADPTNSADANGEPLTIDGKPLLNWKSRQEMSFLVTQSLVLGEKPAKGEADTRETGMLPAGVWDVKVDNADGFSTESLGSLAVVDKPELQMPSPGVVCLDQGPRELTLTGKTFLRNGDVKAQLAVEGVAAPLVMTLADCTAIEHEGLDAEVCTSASVTLEEGGVAVGFPALTVQNPETAACASEEAIKLRVVPPPTLDQVEPSLSCVAESDRMFVVSGKDFLRIDGSDPTVTVGAEAFPVDSMDGCQPLETQGHDVQTCSSLSITIAQDALPPDLYAVTVENPQPAGCDATATGLLRIVPPPSIDDVAPALVCLDDGGREVVVTGADFLVVGDEEPAVEVDGAALDPDDVEPAGCEALETDRLDVQKCDTLVLTLAEGSVDLGMPQIHVENPSPAGCSDSRDDLLTVVAGPTIKKAEPALLCTIGGDREITIRGTGFLSVDDELPAVRIAGDDVDSVDSVDDCDDVIANGLDVQSCKTLVVTVAEDSLDEGLQDIEVTNPDPAGCTATRKHALTVPPELEIATLVPLNVCKDDANATLGLTLTGAGFLDVKGDLPTVTFAVGTADEQEVTPTLSACDDLEVDGLDGGDVQTCEQLDVTVDLTSTLVASAGAIPITVENANAEACDLAAMTVLNVVEPPTVLETCNAVADTGPGTGTDPCVEITGAPSNSEVCSDIGFTLVITGSGFVEGATVMLDNDDDELDTQATTVVVDSATQITATFASGLRFNKSDSDFDLIVANAGNCAGPVVTGLIDVNPTPLVFFVDPPVVYNDLSVDVTVFAAGLSADSALDKIELIDGTGDVDELTVVDNTKPSRIVANVPNQDPDTSSPYAPGDYTVRVTSVLGCAGELPGGIEVTSTLDNSLLTSIAPSFVSKTSPTAVTINGSGFNAVPRVYISTGTGTATPLEAVEVRSGTVLTGIVPGGLSAGAYDLIVVNPVGGGWKVDVLPGGLVVTDDEPPVITSVVPASLPANDSGTITLTGTGFYPTATVELRCKLGAGALNVVTGSVNSVTGGGTTASVDVDLSAGSPADPGAGSVCVVRLTNPGPDNGTAADDAYFDYSALSVTNSSLNLSGWTAGTALRDGRRAPAALAGRPTQTSRFLYAIGGDAGAGSDELSRGAVRTSAEAATVDLFGAMGAWQYQRNDLSTTVVGGTPTSTPRTQAGSARIGQFMYLVGGHDGTNAQATLLRAQILDPTATPAIDELDAELGDPDAGTGLAGGLYYYRVAAIFPSDDDNNPGGESLPGELLPVQLPDRDEGIVLSLSWAPIPGAHGYRVYRTPMEGAAADELELLAEQSCGTLATDVCDCGANADDCAYTDDGTVSTMGSETPMPAGSLGVWHAVDGARCEDADCALASAREGLVTVAVRDRVESSTTTDTYYLYAFGGRSAAGTYLASFELATVTVNLASPGVAETQTVADWVAGANDFVSPRADLGAWVMNAESSALIRGSGTPNAVWIYLGGGRTTGGSTSDGSIAAALVQAGGNLGAWISDGDANGLVGLGAGYANDQLYTFGGNATADGTSAALCGSPAAKGGGCSGGITDPPDIENFNSLGGAGAVDRMFMGYTQESAFFFLVGGHNGDNVLSSTQGGVQ